MNTGLVSIVLVGFFVFYAAAIALRPTHHSFALYGALTLLVVGVSLLPLIASFSEESEEED